MMLYYTFLSIVLVSFLVCVIITIVDNSNSEEKKVEVVDDSNCKSRRSLYNDYLKKISTNYTYYSYSKENTTKSISVVKVEEDTATEPVIVSDATDYTEEVAVTITEPIITSVVDVIEEEEEIDDGMPTMLVPVLEINK